MIQDIEEMQNGSRFANERCCEMNKNITTVVLWANLLFYIGIFGSVYLFLIDDNTPMWMLTILCIVVGIIGSAIPDSMINVGIEEIAMCALFGDYYAIVTDLIMKRKTSIFSKDIIERI